MSPNEQWSLEEMTLRQLRTVAQQYKVSRYSRMTKSELIEAIQEAQVQQLTSRRSRGLEAQAEVEDTKFRVGASESVDLTDIDADLGDLPAGYGESRIVILPRDPQWAYVYWDVPGEHKDALRSQGGQQLALRLHDVTDVYFDGYNAHSVQEFPIDELAREWYLPLPVSDRDFIVDVGYRTGDGRWLVLARSASVKVPPMYPSDWIDDRFITLPFDMDLRGKTVYTLEPPYRAASLRTGLRPEGGETIGVGPHEAMFQFAGGMEAAVTGSLFGSMQQLPETALSSFASPSGIGMFSAAFSGGIFSGASVPPERDRGFWLVADAELIIYGATEPDATVTIGGQRIELAADGTFRFQYYFPDSMMNFPIEAVAADGEQNRAITMRFLRNTPLRNTNTKAEVVLEAY